MNPLHSKIAARFGLILATALCSLAFLFSCGEVDGNNPYAQHKRIELKSDAEIAGAFVGKWNVPDGRFESFEFLPNGMYIVVERKGQIAQKPLVALAKNSDGDPQVYFGDWKVEDGQIKLSNFGGLSDLTALTGQALRLGFTVTTSDGVNYTVESGTPDPAFNDPKSISLSKVWLSTGVYLDAGLTQSDPETHGSGYTVLFTRAGTYLVLYSNSPGLVESSEARDVGIANWGWNGSNTINYAWKNSLSGELEVIGAIDGTLLIKEDDKYFAFNKMNIGVSTSGTAKEGGSVAGVPSISPLIAGGCTYAFKADGADISGCSGGISGTPSCALSSSEACKSITLDITCPDYGTVSGEWSAPAEMTPPSISPAGPTAVPAITQGSTTTLTATAPSCAGCTYQWYRNDTAIPSATALTYTVPSTEVTGTHSYKAAAIRAVGTCEPDTANTTFTVTVNAPTYTITYNNNGGTGTIANGTKTHDVAFTLSNGTGFSRTGYTFDGWNTATGGTGTAYAGGTSYTANANLTLYAQWKVNTYTITYNNNGGTGTIANGTKTYNVAFTLSDGTGFSRTGYTFDGWNTATGGTGTAYAGGASYTANANLTLYAQWKAIPSSSSVTPSSSSAACIAITGNFSNTPNTCRTYTCNGELQMRYGGGSNRTVTLSGGCSGTATVPSGNTWSTVCNSTGEVRIDIDVAFDGEIMNAQCVVPSSSSVTPSSSSVADLCAGLTITNVDRPDGTGTRQRCSEFTGTGRTDTTTKAYPYNHTTPLQITTANPTVCRSLTCNGILEVWYNSVGTPMTLNASGNGCSATGMSITGSGAGGTGVADPGVTGSLNGGWTTICPSANGLITIQTIVSRSANIAFRCREHAPCMPASSSSAAVTVTVTLDRQSGTGGSTSFTATVGSPLPAITLPTRTGYTFSGYWTAASGGSQVINTAGTAFMSNVAGYTSGTNWNRTTATTLYARWTANTYTVTLNRNGGTTGSTSFTATYGSGMPGGVTMPTQSGYTFNGYYTAASGGTQVINASGAFVNATGYVTGGNWTRTSNTTLYAQWTAVPSSSSVAPSSSSAGGGSITLSTSYQQVTNGTVINCSSGDITANKGVQCYRNPSGDINNLFTDCSGVSQCGIPSWASETNPNYMMGCANAPRTIQNVTGSVYCRIQP